MRLILLCLSTLFLIACGNKPDQKTSEKKPTYDAIKIAGAMSNVMWKGELGGIINLDTVNNKKGLYALGPMAYLRGELLVNNGKSYLSTVTSDTSMKVEQTSAVSAPFLVYGNVNKWEQLNLPASVKNIKDLENFIKENTGDRKRPFAFKLAGNIKSGVIHIQNLAKGSKVSSPEEAHRGQVKYTLGQETVEIVGFFSTEHHGVFTHHDSNVHLHLITQDESKMGHLDEVAFDTMHLFLPLQ
jgi:acetolactate decarboxylase